jgi:hypothetical protein
VTRDPAVALSPFPWCSVEVAQALIFFFANLRASGEAERLGTRLGSRAPDLLDYFDAATESASTIPG